ncbi:MAG: TlpA family protein disulfide reductase [Bacteroidia bacterium]
MLITIKLKSFQRVLLIFWIFFISFVYSQNQNILTLKLEDIPGSKVFLAGYEYDQILILDSAHTDMNGTAVFKCPDQVLAGMYLITDATKSSSYFDFFMDGNFPLQIQCQVHNAHTTLHSSTHAINESYFEWNRKLSNWNRDLERCQILRETQGNQSTDVTHTIAQIQKRSLMYCDSLFKKNYTNVFGQMLKLKINPPRTYSKVPADSVKQRLEFKRRYWQFIDFSKPELITNPFLAPRIQEYFENWVSLHPDSVTAEIFRMVTNMHMQKKSKTYVISHLMSMYENRNELVFDKSKKPRGMQDVFVELVNTYIRSGFLDASFDSETRNRMLNRIQQIEPLLTGKPLPELLVLDTMNTRIAQSWGFKVGISSENAQRLYELRKAQLESMFYSFNTKNGPLQLLLFWSTDCPHCISELPIIQDRLKPLIESGLLKVLAINVIDTDYKGWLNFIREKNLNFFKHYADPVHLNKFKTTFDIQATPAFMLLDAESTIISHHQSLTELLSTLQKIQNQSNTR